MFTNGLSKKKCSETFKMFTTAGIKPKRVFRKAYISVDRVIN